MNPPTVYLLGAGAIGLTFAYFLRQAGINVTLVLRDEKQVALFQQQNEFHYCIEEQTHFIRCEATLASHLLQPIEYLIVCTKAFDVIQALENMQHVLDKKTKILISHNGLGLATQIQNLYPQLSIAYALTTMAAYRKNNFDIVMNGYGKIMLDSDLFLTLLKKTTLAITVESDFKKASWQKFVVNCAINSLTTIYQCKNGELITSEHSRKLVEEIIREIIAIASLQNIEIEFETARQQVFSVAHHTATNYSSMLQDVIRKQATEIDYLNAYVVFLAQKHNKKVPYNLTLTNIIKRLHHDYT